MKKLILLLVIFLTFTGCNSGNNPNDIYLSENRIADLAILKIEMEGIDLLRKVRADDRLEHIPFIMLTSDDSPENIEEANLMGVSAFISKPFRSDPLLKKIEELLKKH